MIQFVDLSRVGADAFLIGGAFFMRHGDQGRTSLEGLPVTVPLNLG